MPYILADPSSRLNLSHDWDAWLEAPDTIASRQWTITPLDSTSPVSPTLSGDTGDVVVVEALLAGRVYHLTETVVTDAGITDSRTIVIRCEDT